MQLIEFKHITRRVQEVESNRGYYSLAFFYDQFASDLFTFQGCRYLVIELLLVGDLQKVFELHKNRSAKCKRGKMKVKM